MNIIEVENEFYVLASSSFADERTLVLKQGDTFAVFDRFGDIYQIGRGVQGIYHQGTRFLSRLELLINNQRPLFLSSNISEENDLLVVDLTNKTFEDNGNKVLSDTLHILRTKFLWSEAGYENIKISNFGLRDIGTEVSINFDADYADIFEVRGMERKKRGEKLTTEEEAGEITLAYQGLDNIKRSTHIKLEPKPPVTEAGKATYQLKLSPGESFSFNIYLGCVKGKHPPNPLTFEKAHQELFQYQRDIIKGASDIFSSNEQFNDWIGRSRADMVTMITLTPEGPYPYAGVPWFSTPFGRDALITAFECLWLSPEIAKGVLIYLANTQAQDHDTFRDAEPGKILHEQREGEMAELGEIPFKKYYGTIDATPLFISLAGAYFDRTDDEKTIQKIWPNIEKALYWIDHYGDTDGDSFVEYARKSEIGLNNQGWKDSDDSVFHEDGSLAEGPIALCEVQGYVYDAKISAGRMAKALRKEEMGEKLISEAKAFKEKFSKTFWMENSHTFALALDGNKKPCNVVTSNAGHCLFSGIASSLQAKKLAKTLLHNNMFSGWGIRTLSKEEKRYNPMSYHNGSIWPHDNAMIAYGLSRYGLQNEVHKILGGIFDTALNLEFQRLPELFCGFERRRGQGPTAYPVACSPQAWAVGSVFLLIQAFLGLKINARKNLITLKNPVLPGFLDELIIKNLNINGRSFALQVRRDKSGVSVYPLNSSSDLRIEILE